MDSVWQKTAERPHFDALTKDIKTDVLIIGAGLAGLSCAYMLKKAGVNCVLVEANEICSGITKNTTAKITFQHGLIYDKLIRSVGQEKAKMYLEANRTALETYHELSQTIDCDFSECDSFVYSTDNRKKIEKELIAYAKLGLRAEFTNDLPLPFKTEGAVKVERQAQFHPLKFAYAISKDLNIFENTKVIELSPKTAKTNNATIHAENIVIATHFPFLNKHGLYFLKMYQHRSYVTALKNAPNVNGIYVDEAEKGMSFRNYKDLLLVGGGDHRTGKNGGNWRELREFAKRCYPSATEEYSWATQDCMSLDGIPYIGQYAKSTPNLYVATGFNKWGMSSAMVSAMILCDAVLGKHNDFAPVFSPSRSILHPQLAVNAFEAIVNIATPSAPRCPHLGCALKYNREEHSWDCPCHGSRFTQNGELIDNPSTDDINI